MVRVRGFTLLEVMVAFVIASLALTALTEAALQGTRGSRVSAHTQEAISRARSHLAAVAMTPRPGEQSGDDGGGFAWQSQVRPVAIGEPPDGRAARPVLYLVSVDVSWHMDGGWRHVRLETMRLSDAPGRP